MRSFFSRRFLTCLVILVTGTVGAPAVTLPSHLKEATILPPRAWLTAKKALVTAYEQAGLSYAVLPAELKGVVGPFDLATPVPLSRLLDMVAEAGGNRVHLVGNTVVFEPASKARAQDTEDPNVYISELSRIGQLWTIPILSKYVGNKDASIRFNALSILHAMEGDFKKNMWPGRASVFELMCDNLDRDALLWVLTECYRNGSPAWNMVVDVLARSREPYMVRHTWSPVWAKTPGAMQVSLWAMGRSGDQTARSALRKRVKQSFTSDPTDRYLAGIALGMLNDHSTLISSAKKANPEVRSACILGLGLCKESDNVVDYLMESLADEDPRVRFVTCLSLARLSTKRTLTRLTQLAKDPNASAEIRCAALEALGRSRAPSARNVVIDAASDPRPILRARAADMLGNIGGTDAHNKLLRLVNDEDPWTQASALCSLGTLGTAAGIQSVSVIILDEKTPVDNVIAGIIGLGRSRAPGARDVLSTIALDAGKAKRLRRYAVMALAQLANRAGQDTIKALTYYGTPEYLPMGLRYLELNSPAETTAYVKQFLAKGFRETSAAAACRLAEMGEGKGVRELLEGSDVFDNHARMMHMWGAIRSCGPEVISALVEAAKSRRTDIRQGAALALGNRADTRATDTLIGLTEDASSGVRSAAAQSLGITGDPKAIPALLSLARNDKDFRVTSAAIRALRYYAFRDDPSVKVLFKELAGTERDCGVITGEAPSLEDQPSNSFVLRRWANALEDDRMCGITYETSLSYDSHRNRVVLWGAHGKRADFPQTGQTWFYTAENNEWKRLTTSREWPNATCCVWGTTYDEANQVVLSPLSGTGGHGWVNALRANMQYSLPWMMDAASNQWFPMKPSKHKGSLNMLAGSFDARHGVTAWCYGKVSAYDAYANQWWTMSPSKRADGPGKLGNTGGEFDPRSGKLIVVGDTSTWAYDPATDKWTDLKPTGDLNPYGWVLVYDSANHVMLAFGGGKGRPVQVAAYLIGENRWVHLPEAHPSPHYGTFDVAYDRLHNVTVISGGWETGRSGETTVRETWTYRYKTAAKTECDTLLLSDLRVTPQADGKALLVWNAPKGKRVATYRVYRGEGDRTWKVTWEKVADIPGKTTTFVDEQPLSKTLVFYKIMGVDAKGSESPATYPGRTAPRALRWAAASATMKGIRVTWEKAADTNVVGYHVYRAPVKGTSYWDKKFDPMSVQGKLEKISVKPVRGTEILDAGAIVRGKGSELSWPDSFAYVVRAVNAWGVEGGESPVTLAVPDAPGPVRVIPWLDGERMLLWAPSRTSVIQGYYVMRMDDWNGQYVYRWHGSPLVGFGFFDSQDFPTADRRRYYVSGVDEQGTIGIPSSGAWSHGLP